MAVAVSLRVTQAVPARQAIPENAGGALLQRDRDGGSPSLLAETAGVSAPALYRCFPIRGEQMGSALAHLNEAPELRRVIDANGFAGTGPAAAQLPASHTQLVRNLRCSTEGREPHGAVWTTQALELIVMVASMATTTLHPDAAPSAAGVIASLSGSIAWTTVHDEAHLEDAAAQRAVVCARNVPLQAVEQGTSPSLHDLTKEPK